MEGQQQFAFTHVLIRDVAYDLLPRAERARRHAPDRRVLRELDRRVGRGDRRDRTPLARRGRTIRRAVDQLARAAAQAERGWAKDHAVLLYRQALELVPEDDAERRSFIRRRLAIAAQASFHLGDVRRAGSPQA